MKLKVIVHPAEEGGFWAEVAAIQGCATQGDTMKMRIRIINAVCFNGWVYWQRLRSSSVIADLISQTEFALLLKLTNLSVSFRLFCSCRHLS